MIDNDDMCAARDDGWCKKAVRKAKNEREGEREREDQKKLDGTAA